MHARANAREDGKNEAEKTDKYKDIRRGVLVMSAVEIFTWLVFPCVSIQHAMDNVCMKVLQFTSLRPCDISMHSKAA